jgi:DNA-binding LytR/AlgR family response regulator
VNGTEPQSALREMRGHLANPATVFALAAVAVVLALVGPFGTDESLSPAFRALYWGVIVAATYAAGLAVDTLIRPYLPRGVAMVVNPVATGVAVTGVVLVTNLLMIGRLPGGPNWITDVLTIFAIAVIVSAAMQAVIASLHHRQAAPETAASASPSILDRLPLEKRGDLVALSVEDHYVRVRTTRGEEMILMRLSDAILETAPEPGLRVHRSHWVSTRQVTGARRDGDRATLHMSHGGDIPVSRSHIPAVKDAGLLPK